MSNRQRIYAIGDIHGCLDKFEEILQLIYSHHDYNPMQTTIITLGDYIDRGPNSKGVLDKIIEISNNRDEYPFNFVALMGNHEDMLLRDLQGFYYNGGKETLESYGLDPVGEETLFYIRSEKIWKLIGMQHYNFILKNLRLYYVEGNVAFAHAGIDEIDNIVDHHYGDDLLWSRRLRKFPHKLYNFTVHGHTPMIEPFINENVAYIDTGAVFGKKLTCLYIPDAENPNYKDMEIIQTK